MPKNVEAVRNYAISDNIAVNSILPVMTFIEVEIILKDLATLPILSPCVRRTSSSSFKPLLDYQCVKSRY